MHLFPIYFQGYSQQRLPIHYNCWLVFHHLHFTVFIQQKLIAHSNLDCYKDFDEGVSVAQATNKPILLDFTGWACVNCRKVEENVWSDPEIYRLINEELVLISLYVDDREMLADEDKFILEYTSGRIRNIETVGQKWAAFQAINFNSVAQPHYILMMPDGTILAPPQQYTDIPTYLRWLDMAWRMSHVKILSLLLNKNPRSRYDCHQKIGPQSLFAI